MTNFVTIKVLIRLMDGKVHPSNELAKENEVSTKTIQRAIDYLLSAGVCVESKSGRYGGYYLNSSNIPQLLSLSTHELSELLSISSFKQSILPASANFNSLSSTIINSMPETKIKGAIETSNKIILDSTSWGETNIDENNLSMIYSACIEEKVIHFDYTSYSGLSSHRIFYPYCLTLKNGTWYSYGFCKNSQKTKLFKLSRMKNIEITKDKFTRNQDINVQDKPWNKLEKFTQTEITIMFENQYLPEIKEWLNLNIIKQTPTQTIASAKVILSNGLYHKLIEVASKVKVIHPINIIENILSVCKNVENLYANNYEIKENLVENLNADFYKEKQTIVENLCVTI